MYTRPRRAVSNASVALPVRPAVDMAKRKDTQAVAADVPVAVEVVLVPVNNKTAHFREYSDSPIRGVAFS